MTGLLLLVAVPCTAQDLIYPELYGNCKSSIFTQKPLA